LQAYHTTATADIELITSTRDISSKAAAAAAVTMHDKLVQDLRVIHNATPETEQVVGAAQKLLARYVRNKSNKQSARTKRGMARLMTDPQIDSHLQTVKNYSPMCAVAAELDASLAYGTTATFPTLPSGLWDASKFLILCAASYQPPVDQEKHELLLQGMFGGSSAGITLKKTLQSGT
jgi:hypothetical protein